MAETVHIGEIRRGNGWSPIRKELGIGAFGINAWHAADSDGVVIPDHDEVPSGHEEVYVVVAGSARFTVAGEDVDAPEGTVVFVRDPEAKRSAVATAAGTTIVSVGGKVGEAYSPRAWEVNAEVFAMFDRGEISEAKQMVSDALADYPDDTDALYYNLACAEARLGEIDQAFPHLERALENRPSFRELAREDTDLDALRGDPRFDELVGVATPG